MCENTPIFNWHVMRYLEENVRNVWICMNLQSTFYAICKRNSKKCVKMCQSLISIVNHIQKKMLELHETVQIFCCSVHYENYVDNEH